MDNENTKWGLSRWAGRCFAGAKRGVLPLVFLGAMGVSMTEGRGEAEAGRPSWELNQETFANEEKSGEISFEDAAIVLNGENSLVLPEGVLGDQLDFTVEFEVARPADARRGHRMTLVSNMNEEEETGFELIYFPPSYNAGWLMINGHRNLEQRRFLDEAEFTKISMVVKDGTMMIFRGGMLLAVTEPIRPSDKPLRLGKIEEKSTYPYRLRNVRLYPEARLPDGFDTTAKRMRTYGGDMYNIQRVEIENPDLPRILVIGDSISMGYRSKITELLAGRAYVDYWTQGYWHTMIEGENSPLERALSGVVSQGPYDLITFNFGLHSWTKPERSPEDQYERQMTKLVEHIQAIAPETVWVWIRTTPCTKQAEDGSTVLNPEKNDRLVRFQEMTDEIVAEYGIPSVDLYGLCLQNMETASRDGVHWSREGYDLMGEMITEVIEENIEIPAAPEGGAGNE